MDTEIILTLRIRTTKDNVEEVKGQLTEFVEDFLDDTIAEQEGEITEEEVPAT